MGIELADELQRLEDEGSTGVLHTADGVFHLTDGAIASAECARTTGLDRLAAEAGVTGADDWQSAAAGDSAPMIGSPLFETLALLSVFDAAYFLLSDPVSAEFRPAPPHWLAPVCRIRPRVLVRECERRGDPHSGPWPAQLVDRAPVVPVRRVRRNRVVLTGGQAEVLAAAGTHRTVTVIAHDLGRTAYGCLEAVRDLTAAGLIEPPEDRRAQAAPRHAAEPALRRRVRPAVPVPDDGEWEPVDQELLLRLRSALEDLA